MPIKNTKMVSTYIFGIIAYASNRSPRGQIHRERGLIFLSESISTSIGYVCEQQRLWGVYARADSSEPSLLDNGFY